jgi:predicted dehydrogenase
MNTHPSSRRRFLQQSAAGLGLALAGLPRPAPARPRSANERLNLGIIGTAHRAEANIDGVRSENIVALCDIDAGLLGRAAERFPGARTYSDFRKLLEQPGIDAVVVSTADHTHAPAAAAALRLGKHVYCEKPLAHSVHEARVLAELAAASGKATQMGIQIHAEDNYRRVVELVRAGAIGPVQAVHVWCGKSWSGGERPTDTPPVPPGLDWDLWLGPAPLRPYHPTYQPANWRRWWDFGNGTLGDMGCHLVDLAFWALELDRPETIQASGPPVHPETAPEWIEVVYQFPARGERPAVELTWSDGSKRPAALAEIPEARGLDMGLLFVGRDGQLLADYDRRILLPAGKYAGFEPPARSIPDSIGHHAEWIRACKTGEPTTCPFSYSGPLTETILLGNVAYRSGCLVMWQPDRMTTGCAEADAFLKRDYRPGWTL